MATSSKTIVIDARWITPSPSGISVYTLELLRRLPLLAPRWKWIFLFQDPSIRDKVLADPAFASNPHLHISAKLVPFGIFSPIGQIRLPNLLREWKCDLFHSTNYMIPYLAFGPVGTFFGLAHHRNCGCGSCVTTIHDATPLLLKKHAPRSRKSHALGLFRECLRAAVRYSAAVTTVSETSRRDIIKALRIPLPSTNKIFPIYCGVSNHFTPLPFSSSPPPPSNLPSLSPNTHVILYVGRLDPYKGVPGLVDAFAQLIRRNHSRSFHLLIIGPYDPRYPEARQHAHNRGISKYVTFFHDASDDDLLSAYQSASVLVNPSQYEGFGLPIIEAMKCGLPVICADGGSQREVAGDAAEIVPPNDETALVNALEHVLFDDSLRSSMISRGLARASSFSWDQTAAQTIALYHKILD